MSITISIGGFDGKNLTPKLNAALKEISFKSVMMIRNKAILSMKEGKIGRWYVIRKGKKGPYLAPVRDANIKLSKKGAISNRKASARKKITRFKGGKLHVASAPGQSPAVLFGNLAGSIKSAAIVKTETNNVVRSTLVIMNKYANAMEYGNPKTNLSPRPFIRPAIESSKPLIRKMIVEVIKKRFGIK